MRLKLNRWHWLAIVAAVPATLFVLVLTMIVLRGGAHAIYCPRVFEYDASHPSGGSWRWLCLPTLNAIFIAAILFAEVFVSIFAVGAMILVLSGRRR